MKLDFKQIALVTISGFCGGLVTFACLFIMMPILAKQTAKTQAQADVVRPVPVERSDGLTRTLLVGRSPDLSFRIIAKINNKPVGMLVDTGASITVLTRDDAERVGIPKGDTGAHIDVVGINKVISQYRRVGSWAVSLGPIGLTQVPIAVDDSGQLRNSILGQDAFCNIDRILIQHNVIAFQHNSPVAQGCEMS